MLKKVTLALAVILLLLNGIGALYGGSMLISDPSGGKMQMPVTYLQNSPFPDYLIPGIVLFIFNGIFSFVVLAVIIFRKRYYSFLIMFEGAVLIGWILVQLIIIPMFNPLQIIFGIIGLLLVISGYILYKINKQVKTL